MSLCTVIRGTAAKLIREKDRLTMKLTEERMMRAELEDAVIELAELFSEQDDALVELAELIEEGE